jgi:hypothetical protein
MPQAGRSAYARQMRDGDLFDAPSPGDCADDDVDRRSERLGTNERGEIFPETAAHETKRDVRITEASSDEQRDDAAHGTGQGEPVERVSPFDPHTENEVTTRSLLPQPLKLCDHELAVRVGLKDPLAASEA